MRILLAIFGLYLLAFLAVGCTSINGSDTESAYVTIRNRSTSDTVHVQSQVDTAGILPQDSLDLRYEVGGIHRVLLALPHDTVVYYVHIETQLHHSYIDYPAIR